MVTADLSFTSLRPLVSHLVELAGSDGDLIVLCKPQFEADHDVVSEGQGVIRSEKVRQSAIEGVCGALQAAGTGIMGVVNSPVLGPAGNAEFLIHARVGALRGSEDIDQQIAASLLKASELR
jgi:23S rRNA (cytidine1920-2'-O)/16S rRNA (cytidine1409-2'-O)-methyltransferase